MADFSEIKKKILETASQVADASVDLYKKAEGKSKAVVKSTKLLSDISSEQVAIKRLYAEIGKTYYETHKLFPEPELEGFCNEITAANERIAILRAAREELRTGDDADFIEEDDVDHDCEDHCGDHDCGECKE